MPAASGSLEPLGTTTLHVRLSAFQILTATKKRCCLRRQVWVGSMALPRSLRFFLCWKRWCIYLKLPMASGILFLAYFETATLAVTSSLFLGNQNLGRGNAGMFELHKGLASTKVAVSWKVNNMLFDQILFVSVSISFRIISSSNKNTPIAELFPKTCLSSKMSNM